MTLAEIQKQILFSDDFVLAETKKIQYLYTLKHVIRYGIDRAEEMETESVAEHVYGLHIIADYFLPLEDAEHTMDWSKIHTMINYHDIDEIETGDTISYLKTDAERAAGNAAIDVAIQKLPEHMQTTVATIVHEYEEQKTLEAKFTKALDRLEPIFQSLTEAGLKVFNYNLPTVEQHRMIKEPYLDGYVHMWRFYEVGTNEMEQRGFFKPS